MLILFADSFSQNIDLQSASLSSQLMRMNQVSLVCMQGSENRSRETAGRTQSRAGGDIRHAGDLKIPRLNIEHAQSFSNDRVPNLVDARCFLHLRVLE